MKRLSKDKGKVSDSGYTNTGDSQSQRSSGSSLSRNNNRSESSGYCGGHPSTFDSSNYALPKPISRRKEHKKKESKTTSGTTILGIGDTILGTQINKGTNVGSYNRLESSSNFSSNCTKSEEVARVESVDATELGKNNGYSNSTDPEGGVGTKSSPLDDTTSNNNEGFGAVISLYNGLIVDTTPSLKRALGYAREAWVGHSFIDFVHPTDKSTFADHLTKNIALPYADRNPDFSGPQMSLFCSLRKHDEGRSSTTGSGSDESNSVNPARSMFVPFHLTMNVKLFRECTKEDMPKAMFLTIDAQYLLPVYKVPEETIISSVFSTRHDPNCILTHVDHNAVPYFGYLPQDMIGRSLFDLYHPEDLPFIKDIYETVVKMEGLPFRSKPYRFATQSGGYVILETEWSSFINPWKEKIEFVVGHHRVLRGPVNPNVFQQAGECQRNALENISVEVFKESKIIQGEIRALLDKKIQRTDNNDAYDLSRRSNDLTSFVENLLQEFKHSAPVSKDPVSTEDRSISERDSVMLGAISPHHEYCGSKSSSETPPSYNQLNYNDKMERFFNSKPQVSTIDSDEGNLNSSGQSNDNIGKSTKNLTGTEDTTPNDSGSGGNLSSGSNIRTSYGSRYDSDNARSANTTPPESFKLVTLTESLLNKHNIDMEKLMIKRHKQHRCEIKNNKQHKGSRVIGSKKKSIDEKKERRKTRNGKRCGSRSQSRSYCKVSKYDETVRPCPPVAPVASVAPAATAANNPTVMPMSVDNSSPPKAQLRPSMNVWPSGPVTAPPQQTSHICMPTQNMGLQEVLRSPSFSPIVPIYYLTVPRIREVSLNSMTHPGSNQILHNGSIQQNPYVSYVAPPLANMIYPPMVCALAPAPTMYRPFVIPGPVPIPRETQQSNSGVHQQENSFDLKRPESQATSVKAEPGSTMAISESSKKVLSLGEHYSSCVSIDGGGSTLVEVQTTANSKRETILDNEFESSLEDSSDSSFYGAFMNTTSSNSSNRDESAACTPQEISWNPAMLETTANYKEQQETLRKGPPWQESVKMTPNLTYQDELTPKPLTEVLEDDKKTLSSSMTRPQMVNEKFAQLYSDMELGSWKTKLMQSGIDTSNEKKSKIGNEALQQDMPEKKAMSLVNTMRRRRKHNRDKKDYNERHRMIHEIFRSLTGCCPDEKTRTKRNTFSGCSTKP